MPFTIGSLDIRATFGPLLLGGLVAAIFTGVLIAQGVIYSKSNKDSSYIRAMVGVIIFLDITHSVALCMGLWTWFIRLHETRISVFVIPLSISISVVLTALTTIIAHAFFLWRILKLSKRNYWLVLPLAVPAILAFVFACISESYMIRLNSFQRFRNHSSWPFSAGLVSSAAVDVMITGTMMVLLRRSRAKSLSLDAVIDSLFVLTLENGAITSLTATICVIFWLTMDNFIFLGLYFIIDKLYGNSVLAVLNYRKHLSRTLNESGQGNMYNLNVVRFSGTPAQPSPVRTSFRSSSSRSILKLPSQICNHMKDKTACGVPPSEKVFQISVERSVEIQTDNCGDLSAEQASSGVGCGTDLRRVSVD